MKRRYSNQNRCGALTVEFALCFPLLLLMFTAAFEFARTNMVRQTAGNAAYEGARRAIVPGASAGDAEDFARKILSIVGTRGADVEVDPPTIEEDTPRVTVTVKVPLNENAFIAPLFLRDRKIVSSMTLSREQHEQTAVP